LFSGKNQPQEEQNQEILMAHLEKSFGLINSFNEKMDIEKYE